jgi:ATP-dependent Lon protease
MTDQPNKPGKPEEKKADQTLSSELVISAKPSEKDEALKDFQEPELLTLSAIPIREGVLFPSTESVLTFGREVSINALKSVRGSKKLVLLVTQKNPQVDRPKPKDLYQVGTLAIIEKTLKTDDNINTLVRGIGRARIVDFIETEPKLTVRVTKLVEHQEKDEEMAVMVSHLQKEFRKAVHMGKPVEFLNFMKLMGGVTNGELVDQIASTLNIKTQEKQKILETVNIKERMKLVIRHLSHEMKVLEIEKDVVHKTQEKFDKHMRENILRERLRTIQKELGDVDDEEEIVGEYEQRLKKLDLSPKVKEKISKEVKRLRQMSPNNPEAGYVRTWLDTVFELPWNKSSSEKVDIKKAAQVLDQNHYGLEEVKDRILEYIAVMQLKQDQNIKESVKMPTILCFSGPPGVGKTSIGRGIAEALGREFVKVSLGGVKDEAEIRGHRRTYVGAMPGKIISGIKTAGTINPIFMLDEVDKIGGDYKGDPSAALLEALDPEQNDSFEDHYLDLPFDLSKVIFITTANRLDTIPPALLDRLEIIPYTGYTTEEKYHIGKQHLLKKVLTANSLSTNQVTIPDEVITYLIERYTREAGVRNLERTLNKIMRKIARELVEKENTPEAHAGKPMLVDTKMVREYLGPEEYDVTATEETDIVGQTTGLAFTTVGGDTLFIEVALTPGKGEVKLTGKLGDVMQESAQAALTYVKANAAELGINAEVIKKTNVHIHVPEGAVPKDGPSAGITITTAIVSAFTNIPVRRDVAMTGEITLRGRVLRIGGLKEKSIAAHRAGSKTVLIPADNERDLAKIPNSVKKGITFIPVKHVSEVFVIALTKKLKPLKN